MPELFKNIRSNFLNRISVAVITFTAIPYLVTNLGIRDYGLYALLTILIMYMTLADIGLSKSIARFVATYRAKNELEDIYTNFFLLLCSLAIITIIAALILCDYILTALGLDPENMVPLFYLCVANAVAMMFRSYAIGVLFGNDDFIFFNNWNVVFELVKWVSSVYVSTSSVLAVEKIFLVQAFFIVAQTILLLWYFRMTYFKGWLISVPTLTLIKEIFNFSGTVALSDLFTKLISYSDKIIVSVVGSISGMAYYYIAFQVSSKIFEIPSNVLLAYYPKFAKSHAENDIPKARLLLGDSTRITMILTSPIIFSIIFGAEYMLTLWVGAEVARDTTQILQILAVGTLLACFLVPVLNISNAIGFPQYVLSNNIAASVFVLISGVILVERFGAHGGAMVWSAAQLIPLIFVVPKVAAVLEISATKHFFTSALHPTGVIGASFAISSFGLELLFESRFLLLLVSNAIVALVIFFFLLSDEERSFILAKINNTND